MKGEDTMYQKIIWHPITHPNIADGYMISQYGDIKQCSNPDTPSYKASYHSSNGYDYAIFMNKEMKPQLFPIDDIMAMTFITVPDELKGKRVKVIHINGDNRDISLDNLEWTEDVEIWKDILNPPVINGQYQISNWGRIRRKRDGYIMRQETSKYGYKRITINKCHLSIHRIVGEVFVTNYKKDRIINHINPIRSLNYWKNLEWVSRKENQKHMILTNHSQIGEKNVRCAITENQAIMIIKSLIKHDGERSMVQHVYDELITKIPNITKKIIIHIKNKESWKWLSDKYFDTLSFRHKEISSDEAKLIIEHLKQHQGESNVIKIVYEDLKDQINNLTLHKIRAIKNKQSWTNLQ